MDHHVEAHVPPTGEPRVSLTCHGLRRVDDHEVAGFEMVGNITEVSVLDAAELIAVGHEEPYLVALDAAGFGG